MKFHIHSEAGHAHQNEDVVTVESHPLESGVWLCALADGQGGQFGGGAAARVAVEATLDGAAWRDSKQLLQKSTWLDVLVAADEKVESEAQAGYTTLIGLCIVEDQICGASCGDSAVLLVDESRQILLTEHQRKNPPVGSSAACPTAFSATLMPNAKLLVMSDGVWKFLGWDAIIHLARNFSGQELIFECRSELLCINGDKLPDDFTLTVLS